MKNLTYFLILAPFFLQGQENCQGSFTEYYLNSNNIRASFFPRGNKFTDGSSGAFLAPYPSSSKLATIFASSPWLAGFDDAGNFKMATEMYPTQGSFDFSVGPLTSIGVPYYSECANFDRAWSVNFEDILMHQADFNSDGKIDDTIPSIFGWPALGNVNFQKFNGFALSEEHSSQGWAEFKDLNFNNQYEPEIGEYPTVRINGYEFVPDQILWMVFNDVDPGDSIGPRVMRFEFQLTAFALHCQNNDVLNNTIFNNYKIINRAVTPIDSLFFGLWSDYDLGCSEDDFMGSDSARHTEFVYNADSTDGDAGPDCTTGANTYTARPPVQSMTWLSHPMHSFISFNRMNAMAFDAYHHLNGLWGDGTPMRPFGDGYQQDPSLKTTKFHYHGDPRDIDSWAAINTVDEGLDVRSVSSASLGRLDPGAVTQVLTAYMFHYNPDVDHLGQITFMHQNIDSIFSMLPKVDQYCSTYPICAQEDCVWPGDFDKNGIADHRDYLMWGVFNGRTGPARNGQVSWRGHAGEDWSDAFHGINAKHGDADGDGLVDIFDIDVHTLNLNQKNRFYIDEALYPAGSDILMSTNGSIDNQGRIRNFLVFSGQDLENVLGITFEVEFDTSLFQRTFLIPGWPESDSRLIFSPHDIYSYYNTSIVQTNNTGIFINSGFTLLRGVGTAFQLKPGKQIPDSTVIRLRNLKAIDQDGNDLLLGSEPLIIYRDGFVGITDPSLSKTNVYPNPTGDFVYVETEQNTKAHIYTIHGNLIRQLTFDELSKPVDVSNMLPGIYILRMQATGESIKMVVQ